MKKKIALTPELREYFREMGKKGGKTTLERHGFTHFKKIRQIKVIHS